MWRYWPVIRQGKLNVIRFLRLRGTPEEVAKGVALGIFIGMTPTFGFQMVIALFFAWILKENKIAALIGVWVTNPITAPFIYAGQYETGRILLGMDRSSFPTEFTFEAFKNMGHDILVPLCLGSLLHALLWSVIAYALILRFIPSLRVAKLKRWPRNNKNSS
jgi:uncharacterized protein (DUF2062 family)